MPLTKERMFSLIEAGLSLEREYMSITNSILRIIRDARETETFEPALDDIASLCGAAEAVIVRESKILAEERLWWKYTHKRNESERLRQEARRRAAGVQQRDEVNANYRRAAMVVRQQKGEVVNDMQRYREMERLGIPLEKALEYDRLNAQQDARPPTREEIEAGLEDVKFTSSYEPDISDLELDEVVSLETDDEEDPSE
jgi:hypothetical protein